LFGQEIGELKEFKEYLCEPLVGKTFESYFSGKKIWIGSNNYAKDARFFDFNEENTEYAKVLSKPLELDKIKDIDSLLEAIGEKLIYSGSKILGNSKQVLDSDSVLDSTFIMNSSRVIYSKNVAYSYLIQYDENAFGCASTGKSTHILRCFYNYTVSRCFEICGSVGASDCHFSYNIWNSNDCLFSFNLRSKKYMIANIQLDKDQYVNLKKKLLSEISDTLKRKKRLNFSIIDIMNGVDA
jgi:hypothetical protein